MIHRRLVILSVEQIESLFAMTVLQQVQDTAARQVQDIMIF